jgi:hypothetical protein
MESREQNAEKFLQSLCVLSERHFGEGSMYLITVINEDNPIGTEVVNGVRNNSITGGTMSTEMAANAMYSNIRTLVEAEVVPPHIHDRMTKELVHRGEVTQFQKTVREELAPILLDLQSISQDMEYQELSHSARKYMKKSLKLIKTLTKIVTDEAQ